MKKIIPKCLDCGKKKAEYSGFKCLRCWKRLRKKSNLKEGK